MTAPDRRGKPGRRALYGAEHLAHGGAFDIGSDFSVRTSLPEELQLLEHSPRRRDLNRNEIIPGEGSAGETLHLELRRHVEESNATHRHAQVLHLESVRSSEYEEIDPCLQSIGA
ncbi:hypothetical protein [Parasedimentitalea psychrophila]|uniref:Uncharacterized protein n=1 Tax=Parasedimentitalea psychrophila TaxID=2997337 RepID=A0A9Y2P2J2_9RHOB|nr:hypothetical protein [Parasedimentitalea psychrophila]WIY26716.1 hypothetical protein QPJ95_07305 [Parasedimentitalea psychrophila]